MGISFHLNVNFFLHLKKFDSYMIMNLRKIGRIVVDTLFVANHFKSSVLLRIVHIYTILQHAVKSFNLHNNGKNYILFVVDIVHINLLKKCSLFWKILLRIMVQRIEQKFVFKSNLDPSFTFLNLFIHESKVPTNLSWQNDLDNFVKFMG